MFGVRLVAQVCKRFRASCLALSVDRSGSMLPLAVGGLIVLLALIGGGVDVSRVYRVQNRLQAACDAGALAGRKAVTTTGFDTAAASAASSYFNVNFDRAQQMVTSVSFAPTSSDNGTTVVGTATANVKMVVMMLFGKESIPVTVTCKATEGISNIDVTFVLDVTGSMSSTLGSTTRLGALKDSVKNFYTTVANSTSGTSARVRYAFVPFSENVNVGALLRAHDTASPLEPSWLLNTHTVQSRVARFDQAISVSFNSSTAYSYPQQEWVYASSGFNGATSQHGTTDYASLPACQAAIPADTAWTNSGSSSTSTTSNFSINNGWRSVTRTKVAQPQVQTAYFCNRSGDVYRIYKYTATRSFNTYTYGTLTPTATGAIVSTFDHWDYRPVAYNMATYKTGVAVTTPTGSNGAGVSSTWEGCIEERFTLSNASFAYNPATGRIDPTGATDLDIDAAPTSDNATKWAPQWPELAFYRTDSSGNMNSGLLSLTGSQAGTQCPPAATTLATMTSSAFNGYVNALTAQGNTYHDLGMLWGARISSPGGIFGSIVNTAPGNNQAVSRHLILETDGDPNAAYTHATTYGVEYHDRRITDDGNTNDDARHISRFRALCDAVKAKGIRIWVIALATSLSSDMTYCASPNSAYTASSSSALDTAFQSIAKQVGELRISQ